MGTEASFVAYVCEQAGLPGLASRKMFGEYALYYDGKVVALACDNQLFLKPTEAGRQLLERTTEGFPYPGAKAHWRLDDEIEQRELLRRLFMVTAEELPLPKPKQPKQPKHPKQPKR